MLVALLLAATPAMATPVSFDLAGVNDPSLKAHVVFAYDGVDTIAVNITNTSHAAAGPDPRLTAFAFNAPDGVTGVSSFTAVSDLSGPSANWTDWSAPDSINTPGQFGMFDLAAITGPNFNGGKANSGIARGETYTFSFVLTGSSLGALSTWSFLDLLSFDSPGNPTETTPSFIGRFQRTGLNMEGSDVGVPVPEPGLLLLLGAGLAAAGFVRRRST